MALDTVSLLNTSFSHAFLDTTHLTREAENRVDFGQWNTNCVSYHDAFNDRKYDFLLGSTAPNNRQRGEFIGMQWDSASSNVGTTGIHGNYSGGFNNTDCSPIALPEHHFANLPWLHSHNQYLPEKHKALKQALSNGIGYNETTPKNQFSYHNFLWTPSTATSWSTGPGFVSVPVEADLRGFSCSYNTGAIILSGSGDWDDDTLGTWSAPPISGTGTSIRPGYYHGYNSHDGENGGNARSMNVFTLNIGSEDYYDLDTREADDNGLDIRVCVGKGQDNTSIGNIVSKTGYMTPHNDNNPWLYFPLSVILRRKDQYPWTGFPTTNDDTNLSYYTFLMSDPEPAITNKLNFNHVIPLQWKWGVEYNTTTRPVSACAKFAHSASGGSITVGDAPPVGFPSRPPVGSSQLALSGDTDFTIEFYFRNGPSQHVYQSLLNLGSTGTTSRRIRVTRSYASNQLKVMVGRQYTYIKSADVGTRKWHHLAIVHNGTDDSSHVYLDGKEYIYHTGTPGGFQATYAENSHLDIPSSEAILYIGSQYNAVSYNAMNEATYTNHEGYNGHITDVTISSGQKYTDNFDTQIYDATDIEKPSYVTPVFHPTGNLVTTIFHLDASTVTDSSNNNLTVKAVGNVPINHFRPVFHRVKKLVLEMSGLGNGFKMDFLGTEGDCNFIDSSTEYSPSLYKIKLNQDKTGSPAAMTFRDSTLTLERLVEKRLNSGDTRMIVSMRSVPSVSYHGGSGINGHASTTDPYPLNLTDFPGANITTGAAGVCPTSNAIPIMGNISAQTVSGTSESTGTTESEGYNLDYPPLIHTFRADITDDTISNFDGQVTAPAGDATYDTLFGTGPEKSVLTDNTGTITYTLTGDYTAGPDNLASKTIKSLNIGICNAWRGATSSLNFKVDGTSIEVPAGQGPQHFGVTTTPGVTLGSKANFEIEIE